MVLQATNKTNTSLSISQNIDGLCRVLKRSSGTQQTTLHNAGKRQFTIIIKLAIHIYFRMGGVEAYSSILHLWRGCQKSRRTIPIICDGFKQPLIVMLACNNSKLPFINTSTSFMKLFPKVSFWQPFQPLLQEQFCLQ